jgi:asparaginyl-tRNA synthetase
VSHFLSAPPALSAPLTLSAPPAPPAPPAPAVLPLPRARLTSPELRAVIRIQNEVLAAVREDLVSRGFTELLPPIIGPVTDPGARGAKQVAIDYYGHQYRLMTSAILYKQASLLTFGKIFCIAPCVRLEPLETATTGRHLAEFRQIDVEVAGASRSEVMDIAESLVCSAVRRVTATAAGELEGIGRDSGAFAELLGGPFGRITHGAAVELLAGLGHAQDPHAEIGWEAEAVLSGKAAAPFFITDYPKGCRGFYDREDASRPGVLRSFDLIAPAGFGELASGAEREFEFRRVVARIRETGENPAKYGWYLDLLRDGLPASAGFGIGVERLVRYIAGLDEVWQAAMFPKLAGVVSP